MLKTLYWLLNWNSSDKISFLRKKSLSKNLTNLYKIFRTEWFQSFRQKTELLEGGCY